MSETCSALMMGAVRCEDPAAALVVGGCRHEHIKEKWLCDFHVSRLPKAYCGLCSDVDGHICRLIWKVLERV